MKISQKFIIIILSCQIFACGGGSSSSTPTSVPEPTPTPAPEPTPEPSVPVVKILFPATPKAMTSEGSVRISGSASNTDGISNIVVNGVVAQSIDNFQHWSALVPIVDGENSLTVSVVDENLHTTPDIASVVISKHINILPAQILKDPKLNRLIFASKYQAGGGAIMNYDTETAEITIVDNQIQTPDISIYYNRPWFLDSEDDKLIFSGYARDFQRTILSYKTNEEIKIEGLLPVELYALNFKHFDYVDGKFVGLIKLNSSSESGVHLVQFTLETISSPLISEQTLDINLSSNNNGYLLSKDGKYLYHFDVSESVINKINVLNGSIEEKISVNNVSTGSSLLFSFDRETARAFILNNDEHKLYMYSIATGNLLASGELDAERSFTSVTFNKENQLYALDNKQNLVSIDINTNDINLLHASYTVGSRDFDYNGINNLAYSEEHNALYIVDSKTLSEVDLATGRSVLLVTEEDSGEPYEIHYDALADKVYFVSGYRSAENTQVLEYDVSGKTLSTFIDSKCFSDLSIQWTYVGDIKYSTKNQTFYIAGLNSNDYTPTLVNYDAKDKSCSIDNAINNQIDYLLDEQFIVYESIIFDANEEPKWIASTFTSHDTNIISGNVTLTNASFDLLNYSIPYVMDSNDIIGTFDESVFDEVNNRLLILDYGYPQILQLNLANQQLSSLVNFSNKLGTYLVRPNDISLDKKNNMLYVADYGLDGIFQIDLSAPGNILIIAN